MSSQTDARLGTRSHIGFNGQLHEAGSARQLLGNGYRAYNPMLMRFSSSDLLSPFLKGGLNAYAYCEGEPINHADPSGHFAAYILPVTLGLGAVALAAGAVIAKPPGAKVALGVLASIAVVGAAMTYPFKGGTLLSQLRSRGDPGRGMPARQQWKPAPQPISPADMPSSSPRSSLSSSTSSSASNPVSSTGTSSVVGEAVQPLPPVRYAGRGERMIVEEGSLTSLRSFDPYAHAVASRPKLIPRSTTISNVPVVRQKQIRKNREWFQDRRRHELRDAYLATRRN